jgi:hypothetical protein
MSNPFSEFGHHLHLNRSTARSRRRDKTHYPTHRRSYFEASAERRAAEHL